MAMEYPFIINSTSSVSFIWAQHRQLAVPYIAILGTASVIGTGGNLLVIATIGLMSRQRHRGVGNVFVLNLALSDLIVTALINPFSILGVIQGTHFFGQRVALCRFLGSICVISCVASLLTIGNIAMNRYIYICKHTLYNRMYSKTRMVVACAFTWLLGLLIDLPSHVGWSRHTFDKKSHKCIWDRTYRYQYTLFLMVVGVLLPLQVIIIFYVLIAKHVREAKLRLDRYSNMSAHAKVMRVVRQTRMMFLIFLVFSLCWMPYIVVLLRDRHDELAIEAHLLTSMVAHLHASFNFIIYGFGNVSFRKGYRDIMNIISGVICCKKEVPGSRDIRDSDGDTLDNLSTVFEPRPCACSIQTDSLNNATERTNMLNLASSPANEPMCVIRPSM